MLRRITLLTLLLSLLVPADAFAKRVSPLEGQPAVRHRHELRKGRFEIGPSFAISLNRYVRHALTFGARMAYHINDYFSVGADVEYGVGFDTSVTTKLEEAFVAASSSSTAGSATWDQVHKRFADIKLQGDVRFTFTPMSGKVALFSKLFWAYDFFFFAGLGFAQTKNSGDNPNDFGVKDIDKVNDANEGFRLGPTFGFGVHFFFTNWFSMGLELKDTLFADNESGGDITRGLEPNEKTANAILIDGDDKQWSNHIFVGLNFTFFFPYRVVQSR
jgi:outer membrane beta-barrel protein